MGGETWLTNKITDNMIPKNLVFFRKDRKERIGGGVLIAVRKEIKCTRKKDLEKNDIEMICVQVITSRKSILLVEVYLPPNLSSKTIKATFQSFFEQDLSSFDSIIVQGDFNVDCSKSDSKSIELISLFSENDFEQKTDSLTFPSSNPSSLIDLVFCNDSELISGVKTVANISKTCDHLALEISLNLEPKEKKPIMKRFFSNQNQENRMD